MSEPLRIVIGDADVLLREGVARLLDDVGLEVVARAGDADDFLRKTPPDVAVVDVQMPPRNEDDGLQAAMVLRERLPEIGVLVLSQFYEESRSLDRRVLLPSRGGDRRSKPKRPAIGGRR